MKGVFLSMCAVWWGNRRSTCVLCLEVSEWRISFSITKRILGRCNLFKEPLSD
jgi:hypothetical protein